MIDLLIEKIKNKNPIIVGIDPDMNYIPNEIKQKHETEFRSQFVQKCLIEFGKGIIDSVEEIACGIKFQMAFYELHYISGLIALSVLTNYAKNKGLYVILDAKKNDIESSAAAYAKSYLSSNESEDCERIFAHSLTVNPYLGYDGIKPFLEECKLHEKTIFILTKTSNKTSSEFQDLICEKEPLYCHVARKIDEWGKDTGKHGYSSIGAVVGATHPESFSVLRKIMKKNYFLLPGFGAQGGEINLKECFNEDGLGAIVSSSRSVIYAYKKYEYDYKTAAKFECEKMKEVIKYIIN